MKFLYSELRLSTLYFVVLACLGMKSHYAQAYPFAYGTLKNTLLKIDLADGTIAEEYSFGVFHPFRISLESDHQRLLVEGFKPSHSGQRNDRFWIFDLKSKKHTEVPLE